MQSRELHALLDILIASRLALSNSGHSRTIKETGFFPISSPVTKYARKNQVSGHSHNL
jgi:hypothetical protein